MKHLLEVTLDGPELNTEQSNELVEAFREHCFAFRNGLSFRDSVHVIETGFYGNRTDEALFVLKEEP
jgi:hypothetical protein